MFENLTVFHTPSTCRWSRVGYRLSRIAESDQPESLWVCVRQRSTRRSLADEECAFCECWESMDAPRAALAAAYPVPRWRLQCE
jgi:hypothetical protein